LPAETEMEVNGSGDLANTLATCDGASITAVNFFKHRCLVSQMQNEWNR